MSLQMIGQHSLLQDLSCLMLILFSDQNNGWTCWWFIEDLAMISTEKIERMKISSTIKNKNTFNKDRSANRIDSIDTCGAWSE
jgi:hypothetical protein